MIKKLTYRVLYVVAYTLSLLPLRVLYLLADAIYGLAYYIVRYRRQVVRKNLTVSFPDKDETELRQIERRFYHWLCDYIVETLKLMSISSKNLLRHIEFRGVEQLEQCFDEGQNCAAILGHYCNWEWLSATGLAFRRYPQAVMGLIYHPLYNDAFDRLFVKIRSAHGGACVPKKDILRHLVKYRQQQLPYLFGYISDQIPRWHDIHLWLPFLNHDTPVLTGAERLIRKMNDAVFYVSMERPRRGYYICTFQLISRTPDQLPENGVTTAFFSMLEQSIRSNPAYYLWTHNRWKRTHEDFDRMFRVVNGKNMPIDEA